MNNVAEQFLTNCDAQIEQYVSKGVFSNFRRLNERKGVVNYRFKWHMGREFELIANGKTQRLTFPGILPDVEKKSKIDIDFRAFVGSLVGPGVAKHRRLVDDPKNVRIINRKRLVSLSVVAEDNEYSEFAEKLVGVAHQIYTLFLREGGYDDYLADAFDIDLDTYL